jgi:hypothetical protein
MKHCFVLLTLCCTLLASCNSNRTTADSRQITVEYTPASAPWLEFVDECSDGNVVNAEQRAAAFLDPQSVDMTLRIGQPVSLTFPAFQISSEDILVILNSQNPVKSLIVEQVREIFSGQILNWEKLNGPNNPVEVWVYSSGEDVWQIFDQAILGGSPVTSTANLASGPEEMVRAISSDINAVGLLTGHWKGNNYTAVYTIASVPVLVITQNKPRGAIQKMVACLQK